MKGKNKTAIIAICGPTASGKSELATRVAKEIGAEIINADSMQIYRLLDIGTAKPAEPDMGGIRHHLIDIAWPDENFSAADFMEAGDLAVSEISSRGRKVIVAGGTGLYIKALLQGLIDSPGGEAGVREKLKLQAMEIGGRAMLERLREIDPESASRIHPNNIARIIRAIEVYELTGVPFSEIRKKHGFADNRYDVLKIGLNLPRHELYARIEERVDVMISAGLENEVRKILNAGFSPDSKALKGIGYREMTGFLTGEHSFRNAVELIKRNSRRYAKRQLTWFSADKDIRWFEYPREFEAIMGNIRQWCDKRY